MIQLGGLHFTDPRPLVLFGGAPLPAIFSLMVFDVRGSPQPFRAIFIGQTGNAAARLDIDHPAVQAWGEQGGYLGLLNISLLYMPHVRERERAILVKRLVTQYAPELNQRTGFRSRVSD